MHKKIRTALISVFYKDGLEPLVKLLSELGVTIYSTGGTQKFIEELDLQLLNEVIRKRDGIARNVTRQH